MRKTVNLLGCGLALLGVIWTFQGVGLVGGSFMTGETQWVWIGLATVVLGVGLMVWINTRRRSSSKTDRGQPR